LNQQQFVTVRMKRRYIEKAEQVDVLIPDADRLPREITFGPKFIGTKLLHARSFLCGNRPFIRQLSLFSPGRKKTTR